MPTGTIALKKLVLEQVAQIDLYGADVSVLSSWDSVSTHLLKLCLRSGLLNEADITAVIHTRLLQIGRECYLQHRRGEYPDHTISPHALAYAIHNDEFMHEELSSIEFDHGDNLESFMAGEIGDLPEKLLEKLRVWKKPELQNEAGFPACC